MSDYFEIMELAASAAGNGAVFVDNGEYMTLPNGDKWNPASDDLDCRGLMNAIGCAVAFNSRRDGWDACIYLPEHDLSIEAFDSDMAMAVIFAAASLGDVSVSAGKGIK